MPRSAWSRTGTLGSTGARDTAGPGQASPHTGDRVQVLQNRDILACLRMLVCDRSRRYQTTRVGQPRDRGWSDATDRSVDGCAFGRRVREARHLYRDPRIEPVRRSPRECPLTGVGLDGL